jgi:hypothetical protein
MTKQTRYRWRRRGWTVDQVLAGWILVVLLLTAGLAVFVAWLVLVLGRGLS